MTKTRFQLFMAKWAKIYNKADMSQWGDVLDACEVEYQKRALKDVKFRNEFESMDMFISDVLMKYVSKLQSAVAVAVGSPFMFQNNDGIEETEMQMYQHENGGMFAMDCSYLEQVVDKGDDSPWLISDPFDTTHKRLLRLVDSTDELTH